MRPASIVDALHREIRKGDVITYPVRKGSNLSVHLGVVVSLGERDLKVVAAARSGYRRGEWDIMRRMSTISSAARSTIVDPSAITSNPQLLEAISMAYKHRAGELPPWHPTLNTGILDLETIRDIPVMETGHTHRPGVDDPDEPEEDGPYLVGDGAASSGLEGEG